MSAKNFDSSLIGQREERIEKLKQLKDLGINPFPTTTNRTHKTTEINENFDSLEGKNTVVAGRLTNLREHGKVMFADLKDQDASIQLFIRKDELAEFDKEKQLLGFSEIKNYINVGDFVEATGEVVKTKTGEISVKVTEFKLLTKSIRPIPDINEGLKDKELRYRRRYLDIATDQTKLERFIRKAKFWEANRKFLQDRGFIEVETPVLEHKTGGADARPFVTHHNDLGENLYMRISTELAQKRLIGSGFEKVFTLGPNFRNEGTSDEHLQEYYQIEWYWAYADYNDNMEMLKEMFRYIAQEVYGRTKFTTRGHEFDLADEWEMIDYPIVIKEKLGVDIFEDTLEKMLEKLEENGVVLDGEVNRNRAIDNLWKVIRKEISGPAFLINEPKFMSPLAKSKPDNPELTERFHIIIAGSELGNGYTEINNPIDQLERFVDQQEMRESGDDEAQMLDIDYVEMLEYGMPPVSGYGHSERVFWFLEDVTAREGTLFPLMRFELDKTTKDIYSDITHLLVKEDTVIPGGESNTEYINLENYPTVIEADALIEEYIEDDYQKYHSRMVAHCMREYAKILAEKYPNETNTDNFDPTLWEITGLVHDWDYGFDPEGHPENNVDKLKEKGYPEITIDAILGHKLELGHERKTRMAQALVAIDEMAGLMSAYNHFKKGYENMDAKGVKKKFKDKGFAAKVNRDDVTIGFEELGLDLKEHIENMLEILKTFTAKS